MCCGGWTARRPGSVTHSPRTALALEGYRAKIEAERGDLPYARPWEWASFYANGGGILDLAAPAEREVHDMDKDLKSAAFTDAALGKVQMATFSVGDKVQAEDVIGPIADYLGADRDRHWSVSDSAMTSATCGGPTFISSSTPQPRASARAAMRPARLPARSGDSGTTVPCPVDGCPDSPVFILAFDEPPVSTGIDVPLHSCQ